MSESPKFVESQAVPDVDYAAFAAGLGLQAITVREPEQIGPAWDRALLADRPTVLDVTASRTCRRSRRMRRSTR
jgi:pyruvate dehydrogenase (quinone)